MNRSWGKIAIIVGLAVSARPVLAQCTVSPSGYWRNTIYTSSGGSNFASAQTLDSPTWIKFTILACDPTKVYFQNSRAYPFHYDFAREFLGPFDGVSRQEFDRLTLHEEGQQAVLGAVVFPAQWMIVPMQSPEIGIQFSRHDPYDPQQIIDLFNLVKSAINSDLGFTALYFPSYGQQVTAEANRDLLAANGIIISSPARWTPDNSCYSQGWALGELKYVAGSDIDQAYRQGTLGPADILLTDGIPNRVPHVAGIITLAPSSLNSHVAILANTFAIPFVHTALAMDAARAQELVGHQVLLRAYLKEDNHRCDYWLDDTEGVLSRPQVEQILALKNPPQIEIVAAANLGAYAAATDGLLLSDIRYFGGKAASYGLLRRAIPIQSRPALAISFDLWKEFLDQTLASGVTLRQEITARLAQHSYPPDWDAVADDLAEIRTLIKDPIVTGFTQDQRDAISSILRDPQYELDPWRRIRFRSSTNVEDSEHFTGAGLYDSFSGCLADDLDNDQAGPSLCDPERPTERGVFRAIRKVFASFYNTNAFLERLRHGVDEDEVGMALLVHHSFPDETEMANVRDAREITLTVDYESAVGPYDPPVTTESLRLMPCPPETPADTYDPRVYENPEYTVTTSLFWQPFPIPPGSGWALLPPFARFEETRIVGLTSQPLVLRSPFAQTVDPAWHSGGILLFDPWLDPDVPLAQLRELRDQNIRMIIPGFTETIPADGGCDHLFTPAPRQANGRP